MEQVKVYAPVGTDRDKLREAIDLQLDGVIEGMASVLGGAPAASVKGLEWEKKYRVFLGEIYGCGSGHLPELGMPRAMDMPLDGGRLPENMGGFKVEDPRDREIERLKKRIKDLEQTYLG